MQFEFKDFKYEQNNNIEMHLTESSALIACDMGRHESKTTVTVLYDGQKSLIHVLPYLTDPFIHIFSDKISRSINSKTKLMWNYHNNNIPSFVCGLIHCFYEIEHVRYSR